MGRLRIKHSRTNSNKRMSCRNIIQMGGGLTLMWQPGPGDVATRDKVAHRCHCLSHIPPSCQLSKFEILNPKR